MATFTRIKFGDYLNVTDEGGGVIRVDGCPPGELASTGGTISGDPVTEHTVPVSDGAGGWTWDLPTIEVQF